jgi:hypothetical protein
MLPDCSSRPHAAAPMSAPCSGMAAVITPTVSLLQLRARLHGDGPAFLGSPPAHSCFMHGSPLCCKPATSPVHPRRQQLQPTAAGRGDGRPAADDKGGGGGGNSDDDGVQLGSSQYEEGWLKDLPDVSNPADVGAVDAIIGSQREQRDWSQQKQQLPRYAAGGGRPRSDLRRGGRRGPSLKLHDGAPRGRQSDVRGANGAGQQQQLDDLLDKYMDVDSNGSGGDGGRRRGPNTRTKTRPPGRLACSHRQGLPTEPPASRGMQTQTSTRLATVPGSTDVMCHARHVNVVAAGCEGCVGMEAVLKLARLSIHAPWLHAKRVIIAVQSAYANATPNANAARPMQVVRAALMGGSGAAAPSPSGGSAPLPSSWAPSTRSRTRGRCPASGSASSPGRSMSSGEGRQSGMQRPPASCA